MKAHIQTINLSEHWNYLINFLLQSGRYSNVSEIISDSLQLLVEREGNAKLRAFCDDVLEGEDAKMWENSLDTFRCDWNELYELHTDGSSFDEILDIWACARLNDWLCDRSPITGQWVSATSQWIPAPLCKKGDLERWKTYMREHYPSPKIGDIVAKSKENGETIGYKCTSFKNGEPCWMRVKEIIVQQESSNNLDDDVPF